LTRASTKAHLARATLEAICFQTRDVLLAMEQDLGRRLESLKVDGGITVNGLCMQLQADILGVPVSKPLVAETTALGAAYAAGCAVGFWSGEEDLRRNWQEGQRWRPRWDEELRRGAYAGWKKAVGRSLDWAEAH
jgi:glycerol kinase